MAKKVKKDVPYWGLFQSENRWLAGGFLILIGLVAQGIALGFLPTSLVLYWPLILVVIGLAIIL